MSDFNNESNLKPLRLFTEKLKSIYFEAPFEVERNNKMLIVISSIISNPIAWGRNTKITSKYIGVTFFEKVNDFLLIASNDKTIVWELKNLLDEIFACLLRYVLEIYLSDSDSIDFDASDIRDFAILNQAEFSKKASDSITYSLNSLPIGILKGIINDSEFKKLSDFIDILKKSELTVSEFVSESRTKIEDETNKINTSIDELKAAVKKKDIEWKEFINVKVDDVNAIRDSLNNYHNAFNFVGLFDGFKELGDEKIKEKKSAFWLVFFLAFLVLVPLFYEANHVAVNNYSSLIDYFSLLPVFSITIIFIYYFKIALHNYNSIKAQLAQIELRKTLCRFIQDYGDYSVKMKKQDSESLSKFESIIFSSIVTNGDNVPATFDGLEQIAKIIGNLKNSK
ncbi:hypothetical protein HB991_02880 [Yersinia mollaretii]|uniref:Uncharacterized protein n=1 Tax=Yersinia mollaretii TaxID=33060 RepID=A0AA44CIN0_YERMO|nr:hypothetical protein [Yersinia mollaretii]NIL21468.1 hypothetical protein [Yersinia mollaretii]CNJ31286.1 Uncharacterised protein [Yersinia mollaretii]CQR16112.1 Uncharacterised protein [Yersinia mollaretii]